MSARERLNRALIGMAENGQRPRCGDWTDDAAWTSDDPGRRQWAATQCAGCPLLDPCRDVGIEERHRHGVWGGSDLSPTTRTPGRPKQLTDMEISA